MKRKNLFTVFTKFTRAQKALEWVNSGLRWGGVEASEEEKTQELI